MRFDLIDLEKYSSCVLLVSMSLKIYSSCAGLSFSLNEFEVGSIDIAVHELQRLTGKPCTASREE